MAVPQVKRFKVVDFREQEAARTFEEYCHATIEDIFSTPSKNWFVDCKMLDDSTGYQAHPGANVVESLPLSSVEPPYPNSADYRLPDNTDLTTIQKDAVRLAASRFQKQFTTGETMGFLLGDGPGLGKTRILAAIIYNEYLKGQDKRHLFLSISEFLFVDVKAEFKKIAPERWVEKHVKSLEDESMMHTVNLNSHKGVLFMTYRQLRRVGYLRRSSHVPSKVKALSGLEIIEQFFIQEDTVRGVIALDESHVGKNALHKTVDLRSKTGKLILQVLDTYKEAKVVYSTATPASHSRHFGVLSRLEIWSPQKYWKNFEKFEKLMSKWELAAAELMSLKLKQEGAMVCRQISYDGVDISSEKVPINKEEDDAYEQLYAKYTNMWQEMYQDMLKIADRCREDERKTKIATFFSAMMNFFRAIIIHSKMNRLVEMIRYEIGLGNAVVVGIQGTGESSYREYLTAKNKEHDFLISNAKEIMEKLVKYHFCVASDKRSSKRKRDITQVSSENQTGSDASISLSTEDLANNKRPAVDNSGDEATNLNVKISENVESILYQDLVVSSSEDEDDHDDCESTQSNEGEKQQANVGGIKITRAVSNDRSDSAINETIQSSTSRNPEENVVISSDGTPAFNYGNVDENRIPDGERVQSTTSNSRLRLNQDTTNDVPLIKYEGVRFECENWPEVTEQREKWLSKIKEITDTPPNFLDEIHNRLSQFQNIKVAEITGRKLCLKPPTKDDGMQVDSTEEAGGQSLNYHIQDRLINIDDERNKFMDDEANVAIISDAGSTGISLHASQDCKNKRQRVHITVELGWSAEKVLQQLGRTHRANQIHAPIYKFLLSNVPAEIRFTSIILGRLSTMSTFSCAQRHIDFCDRLAEQAQFDSNAAIRGIRDALAVFLGKETSIPYDKGIDSVTKVKEQLNGLGLNNAREQKMFASTDGRTLKRVPLTKILNKLLGCTLDAQRQFCEVWEFFMTHYKQTHEKPRGVVVIPSSYCQVLCLEESTDELIKQTNKTGVYGHEDSEDDGEETSPITGAADAEQDPNEIGENSNQNNSGLQSEYKEHGPIKLVRMLVYVGSTAKTVSELHSSADISDKISGYFMDYGNSESTRYFYLQNVNPKFTETEYNLLKAGQTPAGIRPDAVVCLLHQPHQPPMEMKMDQVAKFRAKMISLQHSETAKKGWIEQGLKLNHVCIHKYSLGECSVPNCMVGKRLEVKYLVEGDLPAIWPDIVATLKDEDPTVVVAKTVTMKDGVGHIKTRFGIIIPNASGQEFKYRVLGQEFYPVES